MFSRTCRTVLVRRPGGTQQEYGAISPVELTEMALFDTPFPEAHVALNPAFLFFPFVNFISFWGLSLTLSLSLSHTNATVLAKQNKFTQDKLSTEWEKDSF